MAKRRTKRRTAAESAALKKGLPPGALDWSGEPLEDGASVHLLVYSPGDVRDIGEPTEDDLKSASSRAQVYWFDIVGVHDAKRVSEIATAFGVHPLAIEDVLHVGTRPKADHYGDHLLIALPMMTNGLDDVGRTVVKHEHIAVVLGAGWVLTFQEVDQDVWDPVRRRIREDLGRIRRMDSDYLAHGLLDAIVDGVFEVLEHIEDEIDGIEERVLTGSNRLTSREAHHFRGELSSIRRVVMPIRQSLNEVLREDTRLISPEVRPYLRDLQDHLQQVLDICDGSRERLTGVHELSLALAGQRLNDVMQVLTVVSTVFLPLSFLAGLYGMNFDVMPELHVEAGYYILLFVMLCTASIMMAMFWRRGWLTPPER